MTDERSLAVEAKWTEPRYETLRVWLHRGGNVSNRRLVVDGWISLLNQWAERPLNIEGISELPYQLIHRAASACGTDLLPALAYLQFIPQPEGGPSIASHVRDDLRALHKILGSPDGFPFFVLEVELLPTESFAAIAQLPKGSVTTGSAVVDALLDGPLFEFPGWNWDSI